jgi:hypothetical protein
MVREAHKEAEAEIEAAIVGHEKTEDVSGKKNGAETKAPPKKKPERADA